VEVQEEEQDEPDEQDEREEEEPDEEVLMNQNLNLNEQYMISHHILLCGFFCLLI